MRTKPSSRAKNTLGVCEVNDIKLGKAEVWKGGRSRLWLLDLALRREYGMISTPVTGFLLST